MHASLEGIKALDEANPASLADLVPDLNSKLTLALARR